MWTRGFQAPGWEGKVSAWSDWYALGVSIEQLLVRTSRTCAASSVQCTVVWQLCMGGAPVWSVVVFVFSLQEERPVPAGSDGCAELATRLRLPDQPAEYYRSALRDFHVGKHLPTQSPGAGSPDLAR